MTTKKFLRRDSVRFSKLGKNRPKLQKWRKPKGRDTQTRLKRKGYPKVVSIGYKNSKSEKPILVYNLDELNAVDRSKTVILARVGAKKKLELIKKAQELKIKVQNLHNVKSPKEAIKA